MGKTQKIYIANGFNYSKTENRQENDYYATDPEAIDYLLKYQDFSNDVWECACGEKHLSNRLEEYGKDVFSSDIVARCSDINVIDFLIYNPETKNTRDIITNPPYKQATEFIKHGIDISANGTKIAMFLKLTFLESKKRLKLFKENPPKYIYVFSSRINTAKNGEFEKYERIKGVAFAWYIWVVGYKGETVVRWIDNTTR